MPTVHESVQVSAPGKLMLLGEHAVLHGHLAIVCAVDRRLQVRLRRQSSATVDLYSELGELHAPLAELRPTAAFAFVGAAIRQLWHAAAGLEISVAAAFSDQVGLGSSAAVTVATVAGLLRLQDLPAAPADIMTAARAVVEAVQGAGSGVDLAASVYGGVLSYGNAPLRIERLADALPLVAIWSGGKTPTPEVIALVADAYAQSPAVIDQVFADMHQLSLAAVPAIKAQDWPVLGELCDRGQQLMCSLGVSNSRLDDIAAALRSDPGIYGAKISGAGLGDCVIGIGRLAGPELPYQQIPLEVSAEGVRFD